MDNFVLVLIVVSLVLFAIIGYLVDSNKKNKMKAAQAAGEANPLASETPEIAAVEAAPVAPAPAQAEAPVPVVEEPVVAEPAPAVAAPAPEEVPAVAANDMFVPAEEPAVAEEAPADKASK